MPQYNRYPFSLERFADGGDVGYGDLIQPEGIPLVQQPMQIMEMASGGEVDPSLLDYSQYAGQEMTDKEVLRRLSKDIPSLLESLGRGSVASVPGVFGDLNQLYLDLGGKALLPNAPKAPTTREILNAIPRITEANKGSEMVEDIGSFLSAGPALLKGADTTARLVGKGADLTGDALVRAITGNPSATSRDVLDYAGQFSPSQLIKPATGSNLEAFNIAKADALLGGKSEQEARDIANMLTKSADNPAGVFQLGDQIPTTFTRDPSFYDLPNTAMMKRSQPLTVGDIKTDWDVFEEVPSLRNTSVEFKSMPKEYAGSYNEYADRIRINSDKWMEALNDDNLMNISPAQVDNAKRYVADSVFQHEAQHAYDVKIGQASGLDPNELAMAKYNLPYKSLNPAQNADIYNDYMRGVGEVKGRLNPALNRVTDEELLASPISKYFDLNPSQVTTPKEFVYKAPNYTPAPQTPANFSPFPVETPKTSVLDEVVPQTDVGFTYTPQQVAQNPYAQIATGAGGLGALGASVNVKAEEPVQQPAQEATAEPDQDFWNKFFASFNNYQEPTYDSNDSYDYGYDYSPSDYEIYDYDVPSYNEYPDYTGGYTEFDYKRGGRVNGDVARMRLALARKKI